MPELPEVETVRRTLAPALGRRVVRVWASELPLRTRKPIDVARLESVASGAVLERIRRIGKYLLLDFQGRTESVLVHLGMSGRLQWLASDAPERRHTHLVLRLSGGHDIRFSDPRRFGVVDFVPCDDVRQHSALRSLGIDPLEEKLDSTELWQRFRSSRQTLKALLLDQTVLAGIGNIYASEALWRAGLHPAARGTSLTRAQASRLVRGVLAALQAALRNGGTSLRDFVAADGREGQNAPYLLVYDRAGASCLRRGCKGRIRRTVQQGRSTYACPRCQSR